MDEEKEIAEALREQELLSELTDEYVEPEKGYEWRKGDPCETMVDGSWRHARIVKVSRGHPYVRVAGMLGTFYNQRLRIKREDFELRENPSSEASHRSESMMSGSNRGKVAQQLAAKKLQQQSQKNLTKAQESTSTSRDVGTATNPKRLTKASKEGNPSASKDTKKFVQGKERKRASDAAPGCPSKRKKRASTSSSPTSKARQKRAKATVAAATTTGPSKIVDLVREEEEGAGEQKVSEEERQLDELVLSDEFRQLVEQVVNEQTGQMTKKIIRRKLEKMLELDPDTLKSRKKKIGEYIDAVTERQ